MKPTFFPQIICLFKEYTLVKIVQTLFKVLFIETHHIFVRVIGPLYMAKSCIIKQPFHQPVTVEQKLVYTIISVNNKFFVYV